MHVCMRGYLYIYMYMYIYSIDNSLRINGKREREREKEGKDLIPLKLGFNMLETIRKKIDQNAKAESWGRPLKDQHASFFTPSLPRAQRHPHKP